MNQIMLILCLMVSMVASAATVPPSPNMSTLQEESTTISKQIEQAQSESEKYSGGLIKTLIDSRIATLKLTKALVDQRITAIKTGAKLKIEAPATPAQPDEAAALAKEIESIDQRIEKTQQNADQYSGGLIKAQLLSTIATMQETRALTEQRMLAAKYGLGRPQASGDRNTDVNVKPASEQKASKAKPQASEQIISVTLLNKVFSEKKYGHGIYFDLKFTASNLDKPARAIKGSLLINDLFGETIMAIKWPLNDPIAPNESKTETGTGFDYNQFMSEHQRIRDTSLENLRASFRVDSILYEDGTRQDF